MGYSVFPAPSSGGSSGSATEFFSFTNNERRIYTKAFSTGVYNLLNTAISNTSVVEFLDSNGAVIVTGTCNSNTVPVTVNLATPAIKIRARRLPTKTDNKSLPDNFSVGITTVGSTVLTTALSGTVTQYTSSQAININGTAYVILVAGGGGGTNDPQYSGSYGSGGGGSGGVVEKYLTNWSGAYTLVIGQGMAGTNGNNQNTFGGTSSLNNATFTMSCSGGAGAQQGQNGGYGGNGGSGFGQYDFQGSSNGKQGGNGGNSGNGDVTPTPYIPKYYPNSFYKMVSGGCGGESGVVGIDLNNGFAGNGNAGHATGFGNGGGGSRGHGIGGNGSGGACWVVSNVIEA